MNIINISLLLSKLIISATVSVLDITTIVDEIYIRLNFAILPWNVIHISLSLPNTHHVKILRTCVQHIKFKSTPSTSNTNDK